MSLNVCSLETLAEPAMAKAKQIGAALQEVSHLIDDPSLAEGHAGLAIFHAYLSRVTGDAQEADIARAHLVEALDGRLDQSSGLFRGAAGVAWAAHHLDDRIVALGPSVFDAFDGAVGRLVEALGRRSTYDLVDGYVGLGVYLLERLPSALASSALERIVALLADSMVPDGAGRSWFTPPEGLPAWQRAVAPAGYFNLGVAHGVPGIIGLLVNVLNAGIARERAQLLLHSAMDWMMSQPPASQSTAHFASWVAPGLKPSPSSPAAWCYGDLGVSLVLLRAARALGNSRWESSVLEIARAAARRDWQGAMVRDASLCHGAAGCGQLFYRLYAETGEAEFQAAAAYWFERVLDFQESGAGIAGYMTYVHEAGVVSWRRDPGFLMGAAGIGLGLLSVTGRVDPAWDRLLLCSGRG